MSTIGVMTLGLGGLLYSCGSVAGIASASPRIAGVAAE